MEDISRKSHRSPAAAEDASLIAAAMETSIADESSVDNDLIQVGLPASGKDLSQLTGCSSDEFTDQPGNGVSMRTLAAGIDLSPFSGGSRKDRQLSAPAAHAAAAGWLRPGLATEQLNNAAEGAATPCGGDEPAGCTSSSRLYLVTPSSARTAPMRRRRSSWAAGAAVWPVVQHDQPAVGLEALSPEDLYRQFVSIRDAVLQKVGSNGRPDLRPDYEDGDGEGGAAHGSDGNNPEDGKEGRSSNSSNGSNGSSKNDRSSGSSRGESEQSDPNEAQRLEWAAAAAGGALGCVPERATWCPGRGKYNRGHRHSRPHSRSREPSAGGGSGGGGRSDVSRTPPHSPHRLSHTSFAEESTLGEGEISAAAPSSAADPCAVTTDEGERLSSTRTSRSSAGTRARAILVIKVPTTEGEGLVLERQEEVVPEVEPEPQGVRSPAGGGIDLQQYYYSPAPSSCCEAGRGSMSPFEGAVTYASDCVAYNALYGGGGGRGSGSGSGGGSGGTGGKAGGALRARPPLDAGAVAPASQRPGDVQRAGAMQPQGSPGPEVQQHGLLGQQEGSRGDSKVGQCLLSGLRLEVCTSMPRTESLFSLHPSAEPQPSIGQTGSHEEWPQQQMDGVQGPCVGGSTGGGAAQMMVWQEELTAPMSNGLRVPQLNLQQQRPGHEQQRFSTAGASEGTTAEEPSTPGTARLVRSFMDLEGASEIERGSGGGGNRTSPPSGRSGALMRTSASPGPRHSSPSHNHNHDHRHPHHQERATAPGGGSSSGRPQPSPDYLEAVRSMAHRTLLPLPRMGAPSSSGTRRRGTTTSMDGGGSSRCSNSSGMAAGHPPAALTRSRHPGLGGGSTGCVGDDGSKPPYGSYVPLPLPRMPSGGAAVPGFQVPPPSLPALHSVPAVVSATAAVLRKCLDKGIPFAVMPAEHFAAVVAAAEQHDGPLAYHIISTHCIYYPGLGRPAASSGGGLATAATATAGGGSNGGSGSVTASAAAAMLLSGGGSGKRATKAATEGAAAVTQLLAEGRPLHVMSPAEYQRLLMGVQYGIRSLHDLLVAQPSAATAAAVAGFGSMADTGDLTGPAQGPCGSAPPGAVGASGGAAGSGAGAGAGGRGAAGTPSLPPLAGGGSTTRRHRRGSSIGSDGSFTAAVGRLHSKGEGLLGAPDAAAATSRPGSRAGPMLGSVSASPTSTISAAATAAAAAAAQQQHHQQQQLLLLQPGHRLRALIQAVQMGNLCRVAYLVELGADVNATDAGLQPGANCSGGSGHHHHYSSSSGGGWGALAGAFSGAAGAATGGRTPLHYAAEAGSFGVAQLLLHCGAFVGVRDGTGRTAHEIARRKGHLAVAQLLKDAAERRRDVVRSCAEAEDRATTAHVPAPTGAAAAPPPAPPRPPPPPRSKQLRCNSAPTGSAAAAARAAAAAAAVGLVADGAQAAAGEGRGEAAVGTVEIALVPPRSGSIGDTPDTEQLSSRSSRSRLPAAHQHHRRQPSTPRGGTADPGAQPPSPQPQPSSSSHSPRQHNGAPTGDGLGTSAPAPPVPGGTLWRTAKVAAEGPACLEPPLTSSNAEQEEERLSLGAPVFTAGHGKQQLSVVLESVDLQQHLARKRSGRRGRLGWLAGCFGCGM